MFYKNVELFNIREVSESEFSRGVRLSRLPESVRNKLNPNARLQGMNATCGEIRFVTDAPHFVIHLQASRTSTWPQLLNPQMRVMVGNTEHSRVELPFDRMTGIPFDRWDFSSIRPEVLRPDPEFGFSPCVWRFVLPAAEIVFGGVETFGYDIRPPKPEENPKHRVLCHGSSITCSYIDGWPMLMGQYLGVDVMNLGLAGACAAEKEIADCIADMNDYDYAVIELGINILGVAPDEFEKRADYMIGEILRKHPSIPLAMITVFPHGGESALRNEPRPEDRTELFRVILRKIAEKYRAEGFGVLTVEGPEIDPPSKCWSLDFTHPRFAGNAYIAFKMCEILQRNRFAEKKLV